MRILADYLRILSPGTVTLAATWFTGRPFPAGQNKVLQLGWAVIRDAVSTASGATEERFHELSLKHSDLGETAAEMLEQHQSAASLSLVHVNDLFDKLHVARGPLAKTPLLAAALKRCGPLEAKYLIKVITSDLRIGLKEGLVEDAVAKAFDKPAETVRRANLLLGDIGATARLASENRLGDATLTPFRPVKFMLASPEETAISLWERIQNRNKRPRGSGKGGSKRATQDAEPGAAIVAAPVESTVWIEDKYDGIRCQLHKAGSRVELYSRDLKSITTTFLELADAARRMPRDCILDGEIVAMRDGQVLPFADLQTRLGRRQGDLFMRDEVPITLVIFDLLRLDEQSLIERPLQERRAALKQLEPLPACLRLVQIARANSPAEIEAAFEAARAHGNEGLVIKDPASVYAPGRRGLAWLKLKKAFATLDCVVVGAEYGHGKRNKVLSDYTFAVRDETSGELKTIGKAYTGLTDVEIADLTQHFLKTATRQHGRYFEVPPETVLEIAFDRIQPSARHNSGLALRFPRIVRIRHDKSVNEIDTLETAQRLAAKLAGSKA